MSNSYSVPFNDLALQHSNLKDEIDTAIKEVISTSSFIRSVYEDVFESRFAELHQSNYCVSVGNGTDAIFIALKTLNIGLGDEVIVPAMSWIATSETVTLAGGKVVFCDIDADTYTLDPTDFEAKISSKTVGVIPVHLYGHPANMPEIMRIASKYGIWVVEDSAQAHLARINGVPVGNFGHAATFSFYPGKNLGAMGDAGCIITADETFAEKCKKFARHGGLVKGEHSIEGMNSRMDGLQAAILNVKLDFISEWTRRRREIAAQYKSNIGEFSSLKKPVEASTFEHVYHHFAIKVKNRDKVREELANMGVATNISYPTALPFLPCYRQFDHISDEFPVAFELQEHVLSLPMYPELTFEQIEYVCASVNEVLEKYS